MTPFYRFAARGAIIPFLKMVSRQSVSGLENIPREGGFIAVANHLTDLDSLTAMRALVDADVPVYSLAKSTLFKVPVLGSILRAGGQIPVQRGTQNAATALKSASEVLADGGAIMIFPEGTLSRDPLKWPMVAKTGAARLAMTSGAPVLPMGQWGAHEILDTYGRSFHPFPRKDVRVTIGELMDLQAGALLEPSVDTIEVGDRIVSRYTELWDVLTAKESFSMDERWRLRRRVEKLNEMGYDVAELTMDTDSQGNHITIQPKVVDAGHYHRQVMRLTGLDVQERQGQRMLNDLEAYRAMSGRSDDPIELVAHAWLAEVFEPTIHSVPVEMRRKLEPAEIFHEILEHRWYMSEAQDRYVTTQEAVEDYVATVLPQHRDERAYLGVGDTQEMEAIVVDDDTDEPMPEDDAEFAARDEQTLADYAANPFGFTAGMKFKGE